MKRCGFIPRFALTLLVVLWAPQSPAGDRWSDWTWPPWHRQPTIGLAYGFSRTLHDGVTIAPANTGAGELLLGGTRIGETDSASTLLRYRFLFFSVANFNSDYSSSPPAGVPTLNLWRFGCGARSGYGYRLGQDPDGAALLLYHGADGALSSVDIRSVPAGMRDSSVLGQYNGAARFGTSFSGGVVLRVTPLISLDAGYQRMVILRRMVFWPWLGSAVIEGILHAGLDGFIKRIGEASPMAKPIVYFALKNALSYGISQLRRANAYTPFASEAPMVLDTFSIGLAFTF
ncbi:MAG TPA: hypothetical protein VML00_08545 [Bacteroidota bacterium]|nr:hypothetical protein [Bacteroidota bacterium]